MTPAEQKAWLAGRDAIITLIRDLAKWHGYLAEIFEMRGNGQSAAISSHTQKTLQSLVDRAAALPPPAVTEYQLSDRMQHVSDTVRRSPQWDMEKDRMKPQRASRPPQDGDFVDVNPEAQWIDDTANACPHCGGSGHKDDVPEWTPPEDRGKMVKPKPGAPAGGYGKDDMPTAFAPLPGEKT